jgi:hypothetical protein
VRPPFPIDISLKRIVQRGEKNGTGWNNKKAEALCEFNCISFNKLKVFLA